MFQRTLDILDDSVIVLNFILNGARSTLRSVFKVLNFILKIARSMSNLVYILLIRIIVSLKSSFAVYIIVIDLMFDE